MQVTWFMGYSTEEAAMRASWVNVAGVFVLTFSGLMLSSPVHADGLEQSESRARFGEKDFAYFFIEAEDYATPTFS